MGTHPIFESDFDCLTEMVVTINGGNAERVTRLIIAEDNDWTLQTVPYLRTLALDTIISNWATYPHLEALEESERSKVLRKLSLNLDLKKSIIIHDNCYWRRRCEDKWKITNVDDYAGKYRRMFLERTFEECLENFVPNQS